MEAARLDSVSARSRGCAFCGSHRRRLSLTLGWGEWIRLWHRTHQEKAVSMDCSAQLNAASGYWSEPMSSALIPKAFHAGWRAERTSSPNPLAPGAFSRLNTASRAWASAPTGTR